MARADAHPAGWRAVVRAQFEPPPDEALLLHAAFAPDDRFDQAYAAWAERVGTTPSPASFPLLQLLAPRLRGRAAGDPLADLCRRQYRLVWAKTQLLERRHAAILALLDRAGIPCLVLKGAALQPLYYRDPGLRAMGDLDLLVRPERFADAMACLLDAGWRSETFARPRDFDIRFGRAVGLVNHGGDLVDLHAHMFHKRVDWTAATRLAWADVRPLTIGGVAAKTLSPGLQLIHQIEHATADLDRNSRWIADGLMLIRAGAIEWARLKQDSVALDIDPLVAEGLLVLRGFGAVIPDAALVPAAEGSDALGRTTHAPPSRRGRLRFHADAVRHAARHSDTSVLRLLPHYLGFLLAKRGSGRKSEED